jgi:hypothetical protein
MNALKVGLLLTAPTAAVVAIGGRLGGTGGIVVALRADDPLRTRAGRVATIACRYRRVSGPF